MQYSTLLIDLDETLFDFNKTEYKAITRLMSEYNIPVTDENVALYSEINDSKWHLLEKGLITRDRLMIARFEDFFSALSVCADCQQANQRYVNYVSQGSYLLDGALATCAELYKHYKLYIITNGSKIAQSGRLNGSPIMQYIEKVYISEEIGFNKPQKEYFDYVLNDIEEKDKSKILVVGDSLQSDIAGAVNAGLDSCWINRKHNSSNIPTYQIDSINKIFEIL